MRKRNRAPFSQHQFSAGHGITSKSNGLLENYSDFIISNRASTNLVVGSGSGLIPMFFADAANYEGKFNVTLLDAGMGAVGFGHPWGNFGWAYSDSDLYKFYPDIRIIYSTSRLGMLFLFRNNQLFDNIFIDANHSESFVLEDLENSISILRTEGVIILHDGNLKSVRNAVIKFIEKNRDFRVVSESSIGAGMIAICRK
jgi:hypothetical protein